MSIKFQSYGLTSLWQRQHTKSGSSSQISVLNSFIKTTDFINYNILKMGWSTNQKAQAKRNRQENKKKEKNQQRETAEENKKWKDEETDQKLNKNKEKQEKRLKQLARKQELKELAEQEQKQLQKVNKKKEEFDAKKLTHAQIASNVEERERQANKRKDEVKEAFYEENPNRALEDYQVTGTVQEALDVLDVSQQKHPEKRFKAAFEAYCAKRQVELRVELPKLKRSQRQQMMRKEFEKHPDNPFNKKIVAYNDKSKKEAKKAKEQEEKEKEQKLADVQANQRKQEQ